MSEKINPWRMHDDDNDDDNEIDSIIEKIQKEIDRLEESGFLDKESDCSIDDVDYSDNKIDNRIPTKYDYINEKLNVFPESTSLLWSAVNEALKDRRPIIADEYFKKLVAIPIKKHEIDTIIGEIKYLLCDPHKNSAYIKKCLCFLQKQYPYREEGLYYEGVFEEHLGNCDNSIELYKLAIEKCNRAPQSALSLAKAYLHTGKYEEAIRFAKAADIMSTSLKPLIKKSDVRMIKCLARYSILMQRESNGETIELDEIDDLRLSFVSVKNDFDELNNATVLKEGIDSLNSIRRDIERKIG